MNSRRQEERQRSPVQRFLAWDWCLLTCCLVGVGLGFAVGFTLYFQKASDDVLMWIGLPGELFMRMLKAAVLPLIISSIITGTGGLRPTENGKVGAVSLGYIIITNLLGGLTGMVLALIIKPGKMEDSVTGDHTTLDTGNLQTSDLFADLIRNLVPDNVITACFQKTLTRYKKVKSTLPTMADVNDTISTIASINVSSSNAPVTEIYERYLDKASSSNVLGLVIVCTVVGMACAQKGEAARPFINFFKATADVLLLLVQWLVMFTPIGAASLIAKAVGGSSDIEKTFRGLGFFVLAEILGNLLLIFGMLPIIHFIFMRRNPFSWLLGATRACLTAMVSTSSMVAMPQHLENIEGRFGVDKRVTSFVVTLVVAINRDASTMFITLTSIYMAQLQGADSADTILVITLLAAVGSLAIPATASSSIVTVLMIMDSLGVQASNIGILLALEWFSDRMRTMANNYSHVLCCLVTWQLCKSSLLESSPEVNPNDEITVFTPGSDDMDERNTKGDSLGEKVPLESFKDAGMDSVKM